MGRGGPERREARRSGAERPSSVLREDAETPSRGEMRWARRYEHGAAWVRPKAGMGP